MLQDIIQSRVSRKIEKITESGCWIWNGTITPKGYGVLHLLNKSMLAHRALYEIFNGPIPDNLQIDHLCRVRCCVNPYHLEAVTARVNTIRGLSPCAVLAKKTHCNQGHPLPEKSISNQRRRCIICRKKQAREYYKAWSMRNMDKIAAYRAKSKHARC